MPDPVLSQIFLNMVSSALSEALRGVMSASTGPQPDATRLNALVQDALGDLMTELDEVERIDPAIGGERLRGFLQAPDAALAIEQLFATRAADDADALELVHRQFVSLFSLWTGADGRTAAEQADRLFSIYMRAVDTALQAAVANNELIAVDARGQLRADRLARQLSNVERNLSLLLDRDSLDLAAIHSFESDMRTQYLARDAYIVPPSLDTHEKRAIDELYVTPQFHSRATSGEAASVDYDGFVSLLHRTVILGDPGGGKSTLALKLCKDLVTGYERRFYRGRSVTPLLVILRDYAALKKQHGWSIPQYIEHVATARYQLTSVPDRSLEYMLRNGRALVVFDGLDELLDTSYRREISADVEAFANLYDACPILVTSRRVGYEQAPLAHEHWTTLQLGDFDDSRVASYANKWFALETDLTSSERTQKVGAFLRESQVVPDIRSNPLMLGLICNIYRGQGYIPANRPEVLEQCAVMLFERWDRSRDIAVEVPFESRLRPAMQYLAHWIYCDPDLQSGVTRDKLIDAAAGYLYPKRFETEEEAREAATAFIDFCKGRAWVFTDTGSTSGGTALFQFTHRTFLEFFTADFLARTHPSPSDLITRLLPHIEAREWDVVCQLAFQLKTKYVEDSADELLSEILHAGSPAASAREINGTSFAARCLHFLVPSPAITRDTVTHALELVWTLMRTLDPATILEPSEPTGTALRDNAQALLADVFGAGPETKPTVQRAMRGFLVDRLATGDDIDALMAIEVGIHGNFVDHSINENRRRLPSGTTWRQFSDEMYRLCERRLLEMSERHFSPALDALMRGSLSVEDFVRVHGATALFRARRFAIHDTIRTIPIAYLALWSRADARSVVDPERFAPLLSAIGKCVVAAPWPIPLEPADFASLSWTVTELEIPRREGANDLEPLPADEWFAAFLIIAATAEQASEDERQSALKKLEYGNYGILQSPTEAALARYGEVSALEIPRDLEVEEAQLVQRWLDGDVELTAVRA